MDDIASYGAFSMMEQLYIFFFFVFKTKQAAVLMNFSFFVLMNFLFFSLEQSLLRTILAISIYRVDIDRCRQFFLRS